MTPRLRLALTTTLIVTGIAATADAQSAKFALVPGGGFMAGYTMAEEGQLTFELSGAPFFAMGAEYSVSKRISLAGSLLRTIGQPSVGNLTIEAAGQQIGEASAAISMVTAGVLVRPMGRTPSGAPTPFYVEGGAGLNLWTFGDLVIEDPNNPGLFLAFPADDFAGSATLFYAGAGVTLSIGPRAQLNIFARASFVAKYSSDGLDDINAAPPVSNIQGTTGARMMGGIGLRVGR